MEKKIREPEVNIFRYYERVEPDDSAMPGRKQARTPVKIKFLNYQFSSENADVDFKTA
jgi:hypothetical protein